MSNNLKIYFLPNLITAGNLCCGFFATLTIIQAPEDSVASMSFYQKAILLLFASCIFDLFDGRVARIRNAQSPFGIEFDSLADLVSFGVAPALLLAKAVLFSLPDQIGWLFATIYLLCGAFRLARYNCYAHFSNQEKQHKQRTNGNFQGIPIPMAAGFIASITFLLIHLNQINNTSIYNSMWGWLLASIMLGLSCLMVSNIPYPSFKKLRFRSGIKPLIIGTLIIMLFLIESTRFYAAPVLFTYYLLYGLIRHLLKKRNVQ